MSNTVHLDLLQAMAAALGSLSGVPAGQVFVELPTPVDRDECPAINVAGGDLRFESMGSVDGVFDQVLATAAVAVKVHTRGSPHTQTADPLIGQVQAALMADPSLGGRAVRLRLTASRPTQAPADGVAGVYELGYEVVAVVDERTLAIVTQ